MEFFFIEQLSMTLYLDFNLPIHSPTFKGKLTCSGQLDKAKVPIGCSMVISKDALRAGSSKHGNALRASVG
ncbi:hypothetical protein BpHYR1_012204 [Brachionus plicatilis]|uniref:Uncharacterized protein n=1 Tax=Brachionus plicatilis TaxID=10195 RepID=A0A3M7REQ0_BRAPC|nr:hypothetical protein BpHYR1_012204 [Brachionus plicatilis]